MSTRLGGVCSHNDLVAWNLYSRDDFSDLNTFTCVLGDGPVPDESAIAIVGCWPRPVIEATLPTYGDVVFDSGVRS